MDKDIIVRNFIRKRELFRTLRFVSLLGLVFYGIVLPDFFPALTMGQYEKAYKKMRIPCKNTHFPFLP